MEIVLATMNAGKCTEFQALMGHRFHLLPLSHYTQVAPEEDSFTFIEHAILKARHAAYHAKRPALGDDSGLMVDALQGAPGVWSARYAGAGAKDADHMTKLLNALSDVPDPLRTAQFICVLASVKHADDPDPIVARGILQGHIARTPRGHHGFGYDPIFLPEDRQESLAELPLTVKNAFSHRARAFHAWLASYDQRS